MVDLHTHSTASAGSNSPAELAALAKNKGLSVFALTDHDTTMGLEEAGIAAKEMGLGFIPGIELEISTAEIPAAIPIGGEFHLLGLGISPGDPDFTEGVDTLARRRKERNLEIIKRMEEINIKADYEELLALSGGYIVGRLHFASLLVKRRVVRNLEQAFTRYLGKGKPLYVPKAGLEFNHALSVIKKAGGLAVLAHPMTLYLAWGRLPNYIKQLKDQGLQGIEAWHPGAKVRDCKRLESLAKSLGLFVTAGSDFHGKARPDRKLGITAGNRKIEMSLLETIPELMEKVRY
ncbi:MAG: PHP domain-containing protein [Treponema sp.]|jgi:predicted metal-dependent phosphoesterase TrpH|nr:PHP domain-containing protein [Treponema sp.]